MPIVCSLARKRGADAGGRAGHERNRTSGTSHADASFLFSAVSRRDQILSVGPLCTILV